MNKKIKVTTVAMMLFGMLAACNTTKTAMDRRPAQTNYGTTNYVNPNTVSYVPSAPVTDQYLNPSHISPGNVRYSRINQDIHRKRNDIGYNYYDNRNVYPPRNVAMPGPGYTNVNPNLPKPIPNPNTNGLTADEITNRIARINGVDKVATLIQGNNILVAVKARNKSDEKRIEDEATRDLVPNVRGRKIHVIADETIFNRADKLSNHLRSGTLSVPEKNDLDNLFNTLRSHNQLR